MRRDMPQIRTVCPFRKILTMAPRKAPDTSAFAFRDTGKSHGIGSERKRAKATTASADRERELAIIGTEEGGTIVYLFDGVNPDLRDFICMICIADDRPMLSDGTTWILPSQTVEDYMVQRMNTPPNTRQNKFLEDLDTFRRELYMPDKYIRPGQRTGGGDEVQDHVLDRRVAAYFRLASHEPVRTADKDSQFQFVYDFVEQLCYGHRALTPLVDLV